MESRAKLLIMHYSVTLGLVITRAADLVLSFGFITNPTVTLKGQFIFLIKILRNPSHVTNIPHKTEEYYYFPAVMLFACMYLKMVLFN